MKTDKLATKAIAKKLPLILFAFILIGCFVFAGVVYAKTQDTKQRKLESQLLELQKKANNAELEKVKSTNTTTTTSNTTAAPSSSNASGASTNTNTAPKYAAPNSPCDFNGLKLAQAKYSSAIDASWATANAERDSRTRDTMSQEQIEALNNISYLEAKTRVVNAHTIYLQEAATLHCEGEAS